MDHDRGSRRKGGGRARAREGGLNSRGCGGRCFRRGGQSVRREGGTLGSMRSCIRLAGYRSGLSSVA